MKPLTILLLEDNAVDASIIQKVLSRAAFHFQCTIATTGNDYKKLLAKNSYDLILSDHQLPDFNALQALQERNRVNSLIPFILITGTMPEDLAISMLRQGADDYILKERMQRLPVAVAFALEKYSKDQQLQRKEHSLEILTERFQLAARASTDIIWDYDLAQDTIYCSNAIEKIVGPYKANLFLPSFLKNFIHPEDLDKLSNSFAEIKSSRENRWRKLFRMVRYDNSIAYINNNAFILRNKQEQPIRIVGVMQDVTELRRLQHEIVEQEARIQRQLSETAIKAQEKEKAYIGGEIHDNVNQLLATAKIMIDTARHSPDMQEICLEKSQEAIIEAIKELRNLSHSLMPPSFKNNSFHNIINNLVNTLNLSGRLNIQVNLPPEEKIEVVLTDIKLTFYRIIQEQLSNILKYANANHVIIQIRLQEDELHLLINDDGRGFDPSFHSKGIGLKNMETRARLMGGSFFIHSVPGQGCTLQVQVPLKDGISVQSN
jgi:two-component system sensor histidine kinase UhpB